MMERVRKYLPWLFFAAAAFLWLLFYLLRVEHLLDADMASEMVLSSILAREHRIITTSWKYSTELRVLNNQLFYSLFLALTGSWRASRLLSGVALLTLYGASYYYLCTQAGLKQSFPCTAALLFLPFSVDYSYIVLYGLYYIPHIAISFTTLGLTLQLTRTESVRKKRILALLLLLLSLAAGLGGPRQLIITYLPLFILSVVRSCRAGKPVLSGGGIAFLGGLIGYGINSYVLIERYQYNGWKSLSFTGFSFARLEQLLMGVLHEYGYVEETVFSAALVKNAACFGIVGALLIYYAVYRRRAEEREEGESCIAEALLAMAAVYFLLYLFTDMFYEDRYALPLIVFAAPLAGYALQRRRGLWERVLPLAAMAAALIAGAGRYPSLWQADPATPLREAVDALTAQGYESGYASYWNGNIVTELSEGQIEMYNWDDYVTEKIDVEELYLWLQPVSHAEAKPEGSVFILLSAQEEQECPLVRYLTEEDVAYRSASYVAYGFAGYEEMLGALSDYRYDLSDGAWLSGGESVDGAWVLYPGAVSAGPNMTFYAGSYECRLQGEGLSRLTVSVTSEFGAQEIPAELSVEDGTMTVSVTVPVNTYHIELRLGNPTETEIRLTELEIARRW